MKNSFSVLKNLCLILFLFVLSSCETALTEITNVYKKQPATALPAPANSTTNPVATDSCDWVQKREFECDGVTYILGLPVCPPKIYSKSVFCKKEFENNLSACLSDSSPETLLCRQEKIGRHIR